MQIIRFTGHLNCFVCKINNMLIEFEEDPIEMRYKISAGPEEDIAFVGKNSYDNNI